MRLDWIVVELTTGSDVNVKMMFRDPKINNVWFSERFLLKCGTIQKSGKDKKELTLAAWFGQ